MRLASVRVREFKSIRDSNEFEIEDVTCLVGKNEAGKTAILEALYRLNPIVDADAKFDVTNDYPRSEVEDYRHAVEQKQRTPARVISASFKLEKDETEPAENALGAGLFAEPLLWLERGYDGTLHYTLELDETAVVRKLLSEAELPPDLSAEAEKSRSLSQLAALLQERAARNQAALAKAQADANALQDDQAKAKALDKAKKYEESQASKQLRSRLAELQKTSLDALVWKQYIQKRVPKFLYFDEYYQMQGEVNVPKLKQREANNQLTPSDRTMLALLDLARLKVSDLESPQNTQELVNRLEGASNYLTAKIFKYWTQNKHLSIRFDLRQALPGDPEGMREGMNLWGTVFDSAHRVTIRLGTRSRGFIWFFSFLAWFSQQRKAPHPMILLLDEPGLFLHASAQGDLLRYIEEELKPHHQVIYTSHSPFMVDPRKFERVRIVRDRSMEDGKEVPDDQMRTKVLSDVLEADEGSLFPLQGALAYDITQTLFVGPNCLVVEGVSDLFYLTTMTDILDAAGREGLSPAWTISPVGGTDKVPTFVALFGAQKGLNIATLIDLQKKDQQRIENLYKQKLLQKKQVLTFAQFTKSPEADVEDMFSEDFYLKLVSAAYAGDLPAPITTADLTVTHPRILKRLESYFEQNPMKQGGFNHYRPARYFAEHFSDFGKELDSATLDRFESAFKALNMLVQK